MQKPPTTEQVEQLVTDLGVTRETLVETLAQLWEDVPGDTPLDDGHDRFFQHCSILAWGSNTWSDVEAESEGLTFSNNRDANLLTRDIIWRVVASLAK